MTEKQITPEIQEVQATAEKMVKLPEKFKAFGPGFFHSMYQMVGTGKDGSPTLNGADSKKVASGAVQYMVNAISDYLGVKGGLDAKFLETTADAAGLKFRDLLLNHNGLPVSKSIEQVVADLIKQGKAEAVLPTLNQLVEKFTKDLLEKQTGFVAQRTEQNIITKEGYQRAAQAFVKEATGKPTDAIGERLLHQYSDAAMKKYGAAMNLHGNN